MIHYWIDNGRTKRKLQHFKALEKQFDPRIRFIEFDDYLIRCCVAGHGEHTILMVPDPPNSIEHCLGLIELLSKNFRVVYFEMPGFGFSIPKFWNYRFSIDEATDIALRLIDIFHIRSCTVAFPCVSGYVGFKLAQLRPDIVHHIIAIQTPAFKEELIWAKNVDIGGMIKTPIVGQLLLSLKKKAIAQHWYKVAQPKDNFSPFFFDTWLQGSRQGSCFCLASAFQTLFNGKPFTIDKLRQSATVIWGKKDWPHRHADLSTLSDFFEDATVHFFEESGHFPELECKQEFTNILTNKLRKVL
ncbi:MAG: alpha/beta hydrolase [Spirosomataceae bacterium]